MSLSTVDSINKKRKQPDTTAEETILALENELLETKQKLLEAEDRAKKAEDLVESLRVKIESTEDDEISDDEESVVENKSPWDLKFAELREYRILNGHCNVPQKSGPLGKWVSNQRLEYKNLKEGKKGKTIKPERIIKLDSIGFSWGKKFPAPMSWDEGLEEIKKYQKAMGHCNIIMNPTSPSPIAKWVSTQRTEYRRFENGRDSLLTLDQITQLKDIGFNWKGPRLS